MRFIPLMIGFFAIINAVLAVPSLYQSTHPRYVTPEFIEYLVRRDASASNSTGTTNDTGATNTTKSCHPQDCVAALGTLGVQCTAAVAARFKDVWRNSNCAAIFSNQALNVPPDCEVCWKQWGVWDGPTSFIHKVENFLRTLKDKVKNKLKEWFHIGT